MSTKKPEPIFHSRQPNICPVCGKSSYSAAGIHPQCAAKQADEKRQQQLKKIKSESTATTQDSTKQSRRWQKTCPNCHKSQHVRKKQCDCGHHFAVKS